MTAPAASKPSPADGLGDSTSVSGVFGSCFRRLGRLVAGEPAQIPRAAGPASGPLPPAATRLAKLFGLTDFETDVLMLAAGVELDPKLARSVAASSGTGGLPTFALAFNALPGGHWDALAPSRPLRKWNLLQLDESRPLSARTFAVDEFVLMSMTDTTCSDPRLDGLAHVRHLEQQGSEARTVVERCARLISGGRNVAISGGSGRRRVELAAHVSTRIDLEGALLLSAPGLWLADPTGTAQLLARSALVNAALIVLELPPNDNIDAPLAPPAQLAAMLDGLTEAGVPALVLGDDMGDTTIDTVHLTDDPGANGPAARTTAAHSGSRAQQPGRSSLAERVVPQAALADLVLPREQLEAIQDLLTHARQRETLAAAWGGTRGHGVAALFQGESGTGKSLAAEAIAAELGTQLFVVDLGRIVSKYIGETEKNLSAVFHEVEIANGILLFDEADALFGRRGEVRDGMDRYANLEVAHLLTRMENHRGVAVLTTNIATAIDRAFHRRLDAIVSFPLPDERARMELWRRVFPPGIDVGDLDLPRLAHMQLTGATIRSIARRAAVAAGATGVSVNTTIVVEAAVKEYRKLGRTPSSAELVLS